MYLHIYIYIYTHMERFEYSQIQVNIDRHIQIQMDADRYRQIQINLDRCRQILLDMNKYTRFRLMNTDKTGQIINITSFQCICIMLYSYVISEMFTYTMQDQVLILYASVFFFTQPLGCIVDQVLPASVAQLFRLLSCCSMPFSSTAEW